MKSIYYALLAILLSFIIQGCTGIQQNVPGLGRNNDDTGNETEASREGEADETVFPVEEETDEDVSEQSVFRNEEYLLTSEEWDFDYSDLEKSSYFSEDGKEISEVIGILGDTVYFFGGEQTSYEGFGEFKYYIYTGDLKKEGGAVNILCEVEPSLWMKNIGIVGDSIYILNYSMERGRYHSSLWKYDTEGKGVIIQEWETVMAPLVIPCGDNLVFMLHWEDSCEAFYYQPAENSVMSLFRTEMSYDPEYAMFTGDYIISGGSTSPEGFVYSVLHLDHERPDSSASTSDLFYYDLEKKETIFLFTADKKSFDLTGDKSCQFRLEYEYDFPAKNPFIITETDGLSQRLYDPDLHAGTRLVKCYHDGPEYTLCLSDTILQINTATREIVKYKVSIQGMPQDFLVKGLTEKDITHFTLVGEKEKWLCVSYPGHFAIVKL